MPVACAAIAYAAYNRARFGSYTEFGIGYQISLQKFWHHESFIVPNLLSLSVGAARLVVSLPVRERNYVSKTVLLSALAAGLHGADGDGPHFVTVDLGALHRGHRTERATQRLPGQAKVTGHSTIGSRQSWALHCGGWFGC